MAQTTEQMAAETKLFEEARREGRVRRYSMYEVIIPKEESDGRTLDSGRD